MVFDSSVFDSGVFETDANIEPSPVVVSISLPVPTFSGTSFTISPTPVTVPLALTAPALAYGQNLAPSPVPVVLAFGAPTLVGTLALAPSPVTLPLAVAAPAVLVTVSLTPQPVAVVVVIGDLSEHTGGSGIRQYRTQTGGRSALIIEKPDFTQVDGLAGPLIPLSWETHRVLNQIGNWKAVIPVNDQLIDGEPLQRLLKRGWRVSVLQENNNPRFLLDTFWMLYQGILENRRYDVDVSGTARLELTGSFRNLSLAHRLTHHGLHYDDDMAQLAEDMVDGTNIIGTPGGIIVPDNADDIQLDITFDDKTRLGALLYAGNYARYNLRESWDHDRPEFVKIDGAPFSGITLVAQEHATIGLREAAAAGIGLIGDMPKIRYDGTQIANVIIPLGSDFDDGDFLTLADADPAFNLSFPIHQGTNPDGSFYYYLSDQESIDAYGEVHLRIIRTDIKNPSDDPDTREQAANVLYAMAIGELIRRRSEWEFVEVPVANGSQIWMLPGHSVRLQYTGQVMDRQGRITWLEVDRFYLVTERHDYSDPSGVRQVSFTLAAPVLEYILPDLPDPVEEDDETPLPLPPPPPPPPPVPLPPGPDVPPPTEPCCDDPETENPGPDDGSPPSVPPQWSWHEFAKVGRDTVFNFTAGLPPPNVLMDFAGWPPGDMFLENLGINTLNTGDHILHWYVQVTNHAVLGVDGAEYNFKVQVGSKTASTQFFGGALFVKGATAIIEGSMVIRNLPAGSFIRWEFENIITTTLRMSLGGVGAGNQDPAGSYIQARRYTNLPTQTLITDIDYNDLP